ncbi:helix-turn-helix domain-containing protein [Rufibacter immobilis]|uniref:helix-turn-helix domain-containing protein n=1 Tax=Rufibacter immobilis TaxID=1348778 RepID=UPI0035E6974B
MAGSPQERFKHLREQLGLTQKEFADKLMLNQTYISAIESGKRGISSKLLKKLFVLFDVSSEWILNGGGEISSKSGITKNDKNTQERENGLGEKRYIEMSKRGTEEDAQENTTFSAVIIASEEELYRRIKDLEISLDRLYKQLMHLGETWWHLLEIDSDWIPLKNYAPPRKTTELVYDEDNGEGLLMKDGLVVTAYDVLSLENKVLYFKELETLRTKWQFDLGAYIKLVYLAVYDGKEHFNKLVSGNEATPVSEEKRSKIKERLTHFASGVGMHDLHPQRKTKEE